LLVTSHQHYKDTRDYTRRPYTKRRIDCNLTPKTVRIATVRRRPYGSQRRTPKTIRIATVKRPTCIRSHTKTIYKETYRYYTRRQNTIANTKRPTHIQTVQIATVHRRPYTKRTTHEDRKTVPRSILHIDRVIVHYKRRPYRLHTKTVYKATYGTSTSIINRRSYRTRDYTQRPYTIATAQQRDVLIATAH